MSDQDKQAEQDKRDETAEDTEGHGLLGGPKPPVTPGNPTGDDSPTTDDDASEGMIPKRIIPKR